MKIRYKTGYKYQTVADYTVNVSIFPIEDVETHFLSLSKAGVLKIKHGYAFDGPSGRVTIHTKTFMRGSLVHDSIFQLLRLQLIPKGYRLEADQELRRICLEDGMWSWRAAYVYRAVRWFGASSASPENAKEIYTAP